jgi:iron complex outermembrane receptor protein
VGARLPTAEDLETKSKRESYQEGLEAREIRESAAKDVGEALGRIDGISKLRKGGIANDVVLRGMSSSNMNVLLDGARIDGACPGHMDPAAFHVDFAEVERVDVTKGGYSYQQPAPYRDGRGVRFTEMANYKAGFYDDDAFRIQTGWGGVRFSPRQNQSGEISYTHQDGGNTPYPYLQMDAPYDIADRLNGSYEMRELGGWAKRVRAQAYYTAVRHWMTDEKRGDAGDGERSECGAERRHDGAGRVCGL